MTEGQIGPPTREELRTQLKKLKFAEGEIIKLRFGLGDGHKYTLAEVGAIFQRTGACIAQRQKKILNKMKENDPEFYARWEKNDFQGSE